MQLHHIRDINDPLTRVIKDDPVRPHIPLEQRINDAAEMLILMAGEEVLAATCMQWLSTVPETEEDLVNMNKDKQVAVFYTIWSYAAGAGRELIQQAQKQIQADQPEVTTYVTLSPKTEMARKFHHRNGAKTYRENSDSVNYLYQ